MRNFNWNESAIETFVEENYNDFLEDYTAKYPDAWEAYQATIVRPSGRPYCIPEEASLELWGAFCKWHESQLRFDKPFTDWIVENLPEIDNDPLGGDGDDD